MLDKGARRGYREDEKGVMRMMAKRLAIVVAMTATTAVPAFAQEAQVAAHPVGPAEGGQYAPVGPTQQEALPALAPVAGSGQYAPEAAAQGS